MIFLTSKGDYLCTVTGGLNTANHGINVAREVKKKFSSGSVQPSKERIECPGANV